MNYDLITKLAKLANNNPNENEANLAARKVCKLLAEGKFEFAVWPIKINQQQQRPNPSPEKQQQAPSSWGFGFGTNPSSDNPFNDFFRGRRYAWEGFGKEPKEYTIPRDPPKTASQTNKEKDPFWQPSQKQYDYVFYDEITPNNDKRSLKCKTCGHTKVTRFRGLADIWECMECRGNAYEREKEKSK